MIFQNREEAARKLVGKLKKYKGSNAVVLAIPRGGVPIGLIISRSLDLPLDLVLSKKIGHPFNPEYAIGSVTFEDVEIDERADVSEQYLVETTQRIRKNLKEKYLKFLNGREPVPLQGKTLIIVDDGLATGRTALGIIKMLRRKQPSKIVLAIPVSPFDTLENIKEYVDEIICLATPENFFAVGQFYHDFSEVTDEVVNELMREAEKIHVKS